MENFGTNDGIQLRDILTRIKVKDVMTTPVVRIHQNDKMSKAEEIFVEKGVYYLPVVDDDRNLVGVITQKYLYKTQSPRKIMEHDTLAGRDLIIDGGSYYDRDTLDSYKTSDMMYKSPLVMEAEDSLADAIVKMTRRNVGCVPIVKGDRKLCGILTNRDIVEIAARIIGGDV